MNPQPSTEETLGQLAKAFDDAVAGARFIIEKWTFNHALGVPAWVPVSSVNLDTGEVVVPAFRNRGLAEYELAGFRERNPKGIYQITSVN